MKAIIPIGAGLIISIAGYMYQQRLSVKKWLENNRIDNLPEKKRDICGVCGSPMIMRKANNGPHTGKTLPVCSRWPDCKKVEWSEAK